MHAPGCMPIYVVKSTDWFKKRALQKTNGLEIVGRKFVSSLVYRVVVETSGHTSVPNSKLSTPLPGVAGSLCSFVN